MRNLNNDCDTINDLIKCYEKDARLVEDLSLDPEKKSQLTMFELRVRKYKSILKYWDGRCTEIEKGRKYTDLLSEKLDKALQTPEKKSKRKFQTAFVGFVLGFALYALSGAVFNSTKKEITVPTQIESAINNYLEQIDKNPIDYNLHMALSELYAQNGMRDESAREYFVAKKLIKKN